MVYVLKLEQGKYYVGYSNAIWSRLKSHWKGNGSSWTKLYKPIRILGIYEGDKAKEHELTLKYMKLYGWKNVKGYAYSQCNLNKAPKALNSLR